MSDFLWDMENMSNGANLMSGCQEKQFKNYQSSAQNHLVIGIGPRPSNNSNLSG